MQNSPVQILACLITALVLAYMLRQLCFKELILFPVVRKTKTTLGISIEMPLYRVLIKWRDTVISLGKQRGDHGIVGN